MRYEISINIPNYVSKFIQHLQSELSEIVSDNDENLTIIPFPKSLALATFEARANARVIGQWQWTQLSGHRRYSMRVGNLRRRLEGISIDVLMAEPLILALASALDQSGDGNADSLYEDRDMDTLKTSYKVDLGTTAHKMSNITWDLVRKYSNEFHISSTCTHNDIRIKNEDQVMVFCYDHQKLRLMTETDYENFQVKLSQDRMQGVAVSRTIQRATQDSRILATPLQAADDTATLTALQTRYAELTASMQQVTIQIESLNAPPPPPPGGGNGQQEEDNGNPDNIGLAPVQVHHQ